MGRMLAVTALVVTACGVSATGDTAVTSTAVPESAASVAAPSYTATTLEPDTTTATLPEGSVKVTVSGWAYLDDRGTVLCPGRAHSACPGIPLAGTDLPSSGEPVSVTGPYDGVALTVAETRTWTSYDRGDLVNPCTGREGRGDPPPPWLHDSIRATAGREEARIAGIWPADSQTVVALVGPDHELADRIRAIDDRICVATGYELSESDRDDLVSEVSQRLLFDEGVWVLESWDGVVDGPVRIRTEVIDSETMTAIAADYGDHLELTAYIEVHDAPTSDLPDQVPPVPSDVDIPTAATRGGVSMAAQLVGAVLSYDAEGNCLYLGRAGERRTVVVWPFGYSAVAGEPTVVYDPEGSEVARTGVPVELGGGSTDIEVVDPSQRCGADGVWQMAGPTQRERDHLWPAEFEEPGS